MSELLNAIASGAVTLHYQPIYALQNNSIRLAGFEALSRWGDRSPDTFIKQAEQDGDLLQFCRWVFKEVISQVSAWQLEDRGLWVSVNLNPQHLSNGEFLDEVRAIAHSFAVNPSTLHLEITEGTALTPLVMEVLRRSPEMLFGLDDFGTGYSNLSQFSHETISFIKVDQSLAPRTTADRGRIDTLIALCTLARIMGIETVLEGIETEEQREIAITCGVDYGQGWLWSKALPVSEAGRLVDNQMG